jgi:hypothetical protein
MSSEIDIVNTALGRIGANLIASLDDPNNEARLSKLELKTTRQTMLRQVNWNFATKWVQLTATADPKVLPEFTNIYRLPHDCLRVQAVKRTEQDTSAVTDRGLDTIKRWKVSGNYVGADEANAWCRYTVDADASLFDPMAAEALIWALAANLCGPLSRSAETRNLAEQKAAVSLNTAQKADGKEGTHDPFTTDGRLTVVRRRGGFHGWT